MADEDPRSVKEKLLFYTTAFFILLGTFSLFAFLFLVPFVIEPGFTTIFMQFDTRPAQCSTANVVERLGVSNCTWSSCKEGCTKELFECIQITVNYVAPKNESNDTELEPTANYNTNNRVRRTIRFDNDDPDEYPDEEAGQSSRRKRRGIRADYDYGDAESIYEDNGAGLRKYPGSSQALSNVEYADGDVDLDPDAMSLNVTGQRGRWFMGAKLFPNVKGCGYPPSLNCTIWTKKYKAVGTNFTCYFSKVDPFLVITDLDLWQNTLNLIYSMAIPIPSFIISVIYLAVAYFKIYNDDEDQAPLDKHAEEIADDELGPNSIDCCDQDDVEDILAGELGDDEICIVLEDGSIIGSGSRSGSRSASASASVSDGLAKAQEKGLLHSNSGQLALTNSTDLNSQKNNDEAGSRGSTEHGIMSNSGSIPGNLSKTMTTSISTPPGPIAAV